MAFVYKICIFVSDFRPKKFAYLHSNGCIFMSSQYFFKNSDAKFIRNWRSIHFRRENTAEGMWIPKFSTNRFCIFFIIKNIQSCSSVFYLFNVALGDHSCSRSSHLVTSESAKIKIFARPLSVVGKKRD